MSFSILSSHYILRPLIHATPPRPRYYYEWMTPPILYRTPFMYGNSSHDSISTIVVYVINHATRMRRWVEPTRSTVMCRSAPAASYCRGIWAEPSSSVIVYVFERRLDLRLWMEVAWLYPRLSAYSQRRTCHVYYWLTLSVGFARLKGRSLLRLSANPVTESHSYEWTL